MFKNIITIFFVFFSFNLIAQEFTTVWNTALTGTGSSLNNQITISTNSAYTYNYIVDWGDGNIDSNIVGNITHTYATPNTYTVKISGVFPAIYFNNSGDRLKIIEVLDWGTIQWQSMENAFYGCANLNFDAIDSPDLSQVTSLKNMFRGCTSFNGIVNNWNVSSITNISGLFAEALIFNRPLDTWNTINITDMSWTFHKTRLFNEPLDNWNTASVNTLEYTFSEAGSFNQNINNWDVSQTTNMSGTFRYTNRFNRPLNNWDVSSVINMAGMFQASAFNQPIANWNVSNVTNMSAMFREAIFNHPIEIWNVSKVTDMSFMFQRHRTYNHPLNNWNVSNVTNMASMFDGWIWGAIYNQPLNTWDVSKVTDMNYMFRDNSSFNQDINAWDVSAVTNMQGMFSETDSFNQDISNWDVSNVTNMASMFQQATIYNQPIDAWDVSSVVDMNGMFDRTPIFNQPLNSWNVGNVTNMSNMFNLNTVFNQTLNSWDTSSVTTMAMMLNEASTFNQNLAVWNISGVSNMVNMLSNSGLTKNNYDNTLIGWAAQTIQPNVSLGATGLNYCDGRTARQNLIDNTNWNIGGDIIDCDFVLCTTLASPQNGDLHVPSNANLIWNSVPGATGYKISVRRENGATSQIIYDDYDVGNTIGIDFTTDLTPGDNVFVMIVPYNDNGLATGCTEESFTVVPTWVNSPNAFKLTYDTRLQKTNQTTAVNQLKIQTTAGLTYNYSIDWGDDQFNNNVTGDITHNYLTPGIYTVSIIGTFPAPRHEEFNSDSFKLLSIDQWGTQAWQSMEGAFAGCENMEYTISDVPNLSSVTNMSRMFIVCRKFDGNINSWNVSNVTNMFAMFGVTTIYNQPLDNWDVSNVTNMALMFFRTTNFNQNINNWDTGNVTSMSRMFEDAKGFNQSLNGWDVSAVTTMDQMFQRADIFNQPLNNWNVGAVTNMTSTFNSALAFNQPITSWNVANVINMSSMFNRARAFNQPLNNWNVSNVNNMSSMFSGASVFNQPLNNWNVLNVITMTSMFSSALVFDQNINSWNVTNVINMQSMFNTATAFNQPLSNWNVDSVVNMSTMFRNTQNFNQPINTWNVSAVANMTSMFEDALVFDQPLSNWDVSSVTLMRSMFEGAAVFNQNINSWNVGVVTQMEEMFKEAILFDQPLANWNTGEVLTMKEMFSGASAFNQLISTWNVSFVATMEEMFKDALAYNQPMISWNVASVTTMRGMFQNAIAFNSTIDSWNVRRVSTMENMFFGATNFNQTTNSWRVFNVQNMNNMFRNATAFNQTLDRWDIGTVSMRSMFENASSFNQNLSNWNISQVNDMSDMLDNTVLSRENYDDTLIAWSEQTLTPGITLGANSLVYCDALEERQAMIDTYGWTFSGDILDCPIPECTELTAPLNGATDVPINTNLTWNSALYARGYKLTVRTELGNLIIVDNETISDTFYEFPTDFTGGETVYVTITPFNDEGDANGCAEENFMIITNTPPSLAECTVLTMPLNTDQEVAIDTDLTWGPVSNADGYKITIGTTTGGNDILNDVDLGNITTYNFTNDLNEDTTYYVSLKPYNEVGETTGCTEESFKTEIIPVPPTCTSLFGPLNGATNVPVDATLSWNSSVGATGYLVVVGTTQGGIEIVNNLDVGNTTTFNFTDDLRENRTHYVTIIPYNEVGDAVGCSEENFRTGSALNTDPPTCTTLSNTLNNATNVSTATNLTWNVSANTTGYKLIIGTSAGGNDVLATTDVGNVNTYNLASNLPEATTIYVSIIPYNTNGDATSCSEESFTTETLASIPDCTALTTPLNGTVDIAVDTNITWSPVSNAAGYKITIGSSTGGNDILATTDVGNVNTYNLASDLPEANIIYVAIIPYNVEGDASSCTEESFTTETATTIPDCTTLTTPLNGAVDIAVDTNITWNTVSNATGYKITIGSSTGANDILATTDVGNVNTYDLASDLPETTTIYVSVIPYSAEGDASSCNQESFTTETLATIPDCTTLTTPLNSAIDVAADTSISWQEINNAEGYRITIGTTSGASDILNNEDVGFLTSYDLITDFSFSTTVYVSISPYNALGNALGCIEESFTIEAEPLIESEYGFSPNGDGFNDFWEIKGIENSPQNAVNIYNRWGDLVFTITNYDNQNNVFRGEANYLNGFGANTLPNGTYFFDIQITGTHNLKKIKGFVVLKR